MADNAMNIAQGIHAEPKTDSTFSLKGMIMLAFRYSLIFEPLVRKSANIIIRREMKSIVRATHLVISPILGRAKFARYPDITAWKVFQNFG
jgi:hypothetical protein